MIDDILAITPGEGEISDWFIERLEVLVDQGYFLPKKKLVKVTEEIILSLKDYSKKHDINSVVIGQSGGIDSALTAALFKQAGWEVHGVTIPIHQIDSQTQQGIENIDALRLERHHIDLTTQFDSMQYTLGAYDTSYKGLQRQGNIKARLRMIALYNLAHEVQGCVGSTDNFSELAAGFWTLHGDVGDVAPIQSLTKSWEVPAIALAMGVPENTIHALPTDGLGISNSDADQLGMNYLEFDILLLDMLNLPEMSEDSILEYINTIDEQDVKDKAWIVFNRVKGTAFKRANPYNIVHPVYCDRFAQLNKLDRSL
jgi:NAD+ synthase